MPSKIFLAILVSAFLASCAGISLVEAGKPATVGGVTVDPQIAWARFQGNTGRVLWTVDGLGLNELHFYLGVKDGAPLYRIAGVPAAELSTYDKSMLPNEVMELVSSTLSKAQYQQVRTANLTPAPYGTGQGFRFDVTATAQDGLEMKGAALAAKRGDTLDVILFIAPAEHYFDHYAGTVDRLFASVRTVGS